MNLRDDLLEVEVICINESPRCKSCNHLMVFHQLGDDGYNSSCDIEGCTCRYDLDGWAVREEE